MYKRLVAVSAAVAALSAAALAACTVMASSPGGQADATHGAAPPVVSTPATTAPAAESPTAAARTSSPSAHPSPAGSPKATATLTSLAGRIRPKVTYRGVATSYDAGVGDGACLFGPSSDLMIGAMNETDYETAKACGAYVLVRASNGATVKIKITNECPLPCAPGQIDLSPQAFAKLADPKLGRIPITWHLLSPANSGTISIRYKTGSSPYWCGIQVIGHRNPVALLEVRSSSGWRRLPRTSYNYFLSDHGTGCGGAIRVTDIYGERLTINAIKLSPDVAQSTRVQFAQH